MIRTLVFLAIVSSAFGMGSWNVNKLSTKVGVFDEHPFTEDEALLANYTLVENPPAPLSPGYSDLKLYVTASNKTLIGLYFDENGRVSGVLLSIPVEQITLHYNMTEQGLKRWTYESEEHVYTTVLFVSDDKQTRIAANSTDLIRADYLTVQGLNCSVDKIPITATAIAADGDWVKEACMPLMGQHYYYQMTTNRTCEDPFYPWFPLVDKNTKQLIGIGFMVLGSCTNNFEHPGVTAVKLIVPIAPECLYKYVENYGACTLHIYFVDNPLLINCLSFLG